MDGRPFSFVGANVWQILYLNETEINNTVEELKKRNIHSIRVMGNTQGSYFCHNVQPTSQNDTDLYDKLDYLLSIASDETHPLKIVLVLGNFWYWTGGFAWYLNNTNCAKTEDRIPCPLDNSSITKKEFINYASGFYNCEDAYTKFITEIRNLLNHANKYKNCTMFKDDDTIMSLEIANGAMENSNGEYNYTEPIENEHFVIFKNWVKRIAKDIKTIDQKHLLTIGASTELCISSSKHKLPRYRIIHEIPEIDYITFNIQPKKCAMYIEDLNEVKIQTIKFVETILTESIILRKPLVINSFEFPNDNFMGVSSNDDKIQYYRIVLTILKEYVEEKLMAGGYFWGWSGNSFPNNAGKVWNVGDNIIGDSTDEIQGRYAIYSNDTETLNTIEEYAKIIYEIDKHRSADRRVGKECTSSCRSW